MRPLRPRCNPPATTAPTPAASAGAAAAAAPGTSHCPCPGSCRPTEHQPSTSSGQESPGCTVIPVHETNLLGYIQGLPSAALMVSREGWPHPYEPSGKLCLAAVGTESSPALPTLPKAKDGSSCLPPPASPVLTEDLQLLILWMAQILESPSALPPQHLLVQKLLMAAALQQLWS